MATMNGSTLEVEEDVKVKEDVPQDPTPGPSGPSTPMEQFEIIEPPNLDAPAGDPRTSWRHIATVAVLCGIIFCSSAGNGLTIVSLPTITTQLSIPTELAFWPTSVTSLASASTILISGSVADVIGATVTDRVGCFILGTFVIAAGAAKTADEMVILRALQGVGLAIHSAASVGIISNILPRGRARNIAYSCLGLSAPLGFSFGLVVGGLLIQTVGWRAGWYILGSIIVALTVVGLVTLPASGSRGSWGIMRRRLLRDIDWIGAILASGFMAMLSYLLAVLSADVSRVTKPDVIILLCFTAASLATFFAWVQNQVRRSRPALIPNSFWKNATFSTICGTLTLSFAVLNSLELFSSLFFQDVQHLDPLQTSVRILPSLIVGAAINLSIGFVVDRLSPTLIVTSTSAVCALSPLLMATIDPEKSYWGSAFVAQLLQPISCDALFTVGLIVITEIFPEDRQALGGAVFNMIAQFGNALGPSIMQIISSTVKAEQERANNPSALMTSYRASFWTMFGMMVACAIWGFLGLRSSKKIGSKTR